MDITSASACADSIEIPEPDMSKYQARLMRKVLQADQEASQELLKALTGLGRNLDIQA